MKQRVAILTRDLELFDRIVQTLPQHEPVLFDRLSKVTNALQEGPGFTHVLIHLHPVLFEGHSPAMVADQLLTQNRELQLVGLLPNDTPPRIAALAQEHFDSCMELPLATEHLPAVINKSSALEEQLQEFWSTHDHRELHGKTKSFVTFSPQLFETLEDICVAAKHDVTSLLIGETGCGKTFLAKLLHELSERRDARFCTVACGALPPDLIESELFGYAKGAFTGADKDREGKFAAAGKGTLLLDEIDVLPPEQQAKLLRVIETGEYEPVGSNDTQKSAARLVVASNYNLEELVRAGTFRTDLYFRLNIINFRLPPLRERPLDIDYLAMKFALEQGRQHGIHIRAMAPDFLPTLRSYTWPGNLRELENVVRRAVLYCQRGVLTVNDLPSSVRHHGTMVNGQPIGIEAGRPVLSDSVAFGSHHMTDTPAAPAGYNGNGFQHASGSSHMNPDRSGHRRNVDMVGHRNGTHGGPSHTGPSHGGPTAAIGYPGQTYQNGMLVPRETDVRFPGQGLSESPQAAPHPTYTDNGYGSSYPSAGNGIPEPAAVAAETAVSEPRSLEARVDVLECQIIEESLQRNNHRRKETAAELGISRVTLYNKMKKFGLL